MNRAEDIVTPPTGTDSLSVRRRYLQMRSSRRRWTDRLSTGLWVGAVALVAWLFIAGFAGLAH